MDVKETAWLHLERVYDILLATYGEPPWRPDMDPLGGLIGTILSQHTSDINSGRAYRQLVEKFPTWEQVRDAPTYEVADAIRCGGLANVKAPRIQNALHTIGEWQEAKGGTKPLSVFLRDELLQQPYEDAWRYLQKIPGVGPKTAACVMLFNLGLPLMPVDTHLHRLTRRLGFIGPKVSANQAHLIFLKVLPPEWAHTFHVDLIQHGRTICHAQRPKCSSCPLYAECAHVGSVEPQDTILQA
ncbi:endonuclease-3 [Thermosporothrix hazakensis]|jgi:endonuclease-3|uniref:Endonuclease-3 n=2 Tax=Thermosporothrix TaxID=768650 RepID=A0A326U785_THEHA|nr:endonuclease III [Thermosporothrix hazakensis]PZW30643.1 endonuclease-3 [Thermosporothrix hazakensis]BBH91359.1 endonuclease III [Thermosporothrix sp. COM3]GCE49506.1 endonuclease III [Thermosporothrix hazakensis]